MIMLLVLYTLVVGVLCAVAGACAERAALIAGRPARWAWAAAIAASYALPGFAVRRAGTPNDGSTALSTLVELLAALGSGGAPDAVQSGAAGARSGTILDATGAWGAASRPVAIAWGVLAGVAAIRLAVRAVRTRRAIDAQLGHPAARPYAVRRARAVVTATLGPAVLGGWRAILLLPRWTWDDLDGVRRRLVFAHEAEHLRAGDPRLLTAAAVLVALAPWNPAGWWMLARLRAAVELDCDRRVLARAGRRAAAPVAAYGTLLLDVAARHAAAFPPRPRLAPALAESPRTTLERRIRQMTTPRPAGARARLALLAFGAVACAALACELPRPVSPRAAVTAPRATEPPSNAAPQASAASTRGEERVAPDSVLIVIDGRVAGRGMSAAKSVARDSILSVNVLKGAAATARYGDAGRAGVVVITRKPAAR